MKKIGLYFIIFIFFFFPFSCSIYADVLFEGSTEVIYCSDGDCSLEQGIEVVADGIEVEKDLTISEYIQEIVVYILSFVSLIAVIYIIYAGFRILTSAGDEETQKNQRKTIMSVIIGIIVIWLAYSIVTWIIDGVLGGK